MTMSDHFRFFTGQIEVREENGFIRVSGCPTETIRRDISKIWSTSKLNQYLFSQTSKHGFSFPSFFAVEVEYLLKGILAERRSWTAQRPLVKILMLLREHTWLKSAQPETPINPRLDFRGLQRIGRKLLPTQIQFLETYNELTARYGLNGFILSAAPGAGKTTTNLALGCCLKVDHHVIVSPKNAIFDVWKREIIDWVKGSTYWIEAEGQPYRGEEYLVCHYEALPQMMEAASKIVGKRVLVTLDESHHMNELNSQRTLLFIDLCKMLRATDVIWSSGTPLKALGYEVIPILRTIDPLFTPQSEERFRSIFGRNAPRGLDILKNRLGLISFKVTKEQVRPDKPEEIDQKIVTKTAANYTNEAVKLQMRDYIDAQMAVYKPQLQEFERVFMECVEVAEKAAKSKSQQAAHRLYLEYLATIRKGFDSFTMGHMAKYCNEYETKVIYPLLSKTERDRFKEIRSAHKYLALKVMGEALGNVLGKARINCHLDMVDEIDYTKWIESSNSKTVIFTSYVQVLEKVRGILESLGFTPVVVYGKTNKDLVTLLEKFKSDDNANPILATYKSLSTAVPLISASTSIFIDQPFRDYIKTQAKARTDRLGQTQPVRFINTILDTGGEPNISTRSQDILAWSKQQIDAILGTEGSAVEIESVDKYYEGFESYYDDSEVVGYTQGIVAMESLLSEYLSGRL